MLPLLNSLKMEEVKIDVLIGKCISYLHEKNYSEPYIHALHKIWRERVRKFMIEVGVDYYSPPIGEDYLKSRPLAQMSRSRSYTERKVVDILNGILIRGRISRSYKPVEHPLDGNIGERAKEFIDSLVELRRKENTITHYRFYLSHLVQYLSSVDVNETDRITEDHIISFIDAWPGDKYDPVRHIKCFFQYLISKKYINNSFMELFEYFRTKRKDPMPSYYSKEEVLAIENSINRDSPSGKRTYAIFTLAARLGLRASDIAALTFSNMDWETSQIVIRMKKTGKEIVLPLIGIVGNSIIDYLQNGRPKSTSERIFLNVGAPYQCIKDKAVSDIIRFAILNSGIEIGNRHYSAHSMRHTLASSMLDSMVPVHTISAVLGHQSIDTTKYYLKIDSTSLRMCSLDVPPVQKDFYEQKGGYFHG